MTYCITLAHCTGPAGGFYNDFWQRSLTTTAASCRISLSLDSGFEDRYASPMYHTTII